MATFNYDGLASTAARLIDRFGEGCKIEGFVDEPAANSFDPPVRTHFDVDAIGVFLRYKDEQIDGNQVRQGDQRVLLSSKVKDLPPQAQGWIVRDSERWAIINMSILKPGPVTMLYSFQVRR